MFSRKTLGAAVNTFSAPLIKKATRLAIAGVAGVALFTAAVPVVALAQDYGVPVDVSLLGGVQVFNKNNTALPDRLTNIPLSVSAAYRITPVWAAEAEFSWIIPVKQNVNDGLGTKVSAKGPDVLAYQANLRATLPINDPALAPYVTAGAGAVTFLSSDKADRVPRLGKAETAFAANFGAGVMYNVSGPWSLRVDYRELAAFPSKTTAGLSDNGKADTIWMERATLGVAYHF